MYTDTDSIITDCNIRQHDDLMKRFMWDGCGNELGALKNECHDKIVKMLTKEELQKQIELDGGELSFDECQILAPKVYSLKKTLLNGKVVTIAKCKGFSTSSYEIQSQLLEGAAIDIKGIQFKAGKALLLKDVDNAGRVQVVEVEKSMSLFVEPKKSKSSKVIPDAPKKLKYSKGIITGQDVLPFQFDK